MARPSLVELLNAKCPPPEGSWSEQSVLERYFARNHDLRWKAFDARATALLFAESPGCTDPLTEMQGVFTPDVVVEAPPVIPEFPEVPAYPPWGPADVYLRDLGDNVYTHIHHAGFHGGTMVQLKTEHEGEWASYPDYGVWPEHYIEEGYQAPGQPRHLGCANPATFTYVFDTCRNGGFAVYPWYLDPISGACCHYYPTDCEDGADHWTCAYSGGSFHYGDCASQCQPWSPEWPLPGEYPCIAEVAAFNPNPAGPYGVFANGAALTVLAATAVYDGACVPPMGLYYSALLQHGCLGEGLRALYNCGCMDARLLVLLGDGTLKSGVRWTGDAVDPGHHWSWAGNWTGGHVPDAVHPENVLHNNGDEIQMNDGSLLEPVHVRCYEGDGSLGGSLRIQADRHLEADADAVFRGGYTVTLEAGPSPESPTQFSVGGTLSGGNLTLNENTAATSSAFSGAHAAVPPGAALNAGAVSNSTFDVTGGQVETRAITGSAFAMDGGTLTVVGNDSVSDSTFTMTGGEVETGRINACTLTMDAGVLMAGEMRLSAVTATDAIITCDAIRGALNWTLTRAHLSAGAATVSGLWTVIGSGAWPVTFSSLTGADDAALELTLECGAQVVLSEATPAEPDSPQPPFPDGPCHRSVYGNVDEGGAANQLEAGTGAYPQRFYIGDQTQIARTSVTCTPEETGDAAMDLILHCDLAINTDFQSSYADWDSTGANLVLRPMWGVADLTQKIELISPAPQAGAPALVYADRTCDGAFGDLTVYGRLDPPAPLPVEFVNEVHNAAIDEGARQSWTPRGGPGQAETAYFRSITVGQGAIEQ